MVYIAKNILGESLPVLQADTDNAVLINGTAGTATSLRLGAGIYRLSVRSSVSSLGVMVEITTDSSVTATTSTGMFMANNSVEYVVVEEGSYIVVIDGILNITKFS